MLKGIASSIFVGGAVSGGTANSILFISATGTLAQDNTNFNYTTASGPRLQVGSGSTTSAGLLLGYAGVSGYAAIWGSGVVTPGGSNYALAVKGDGQAVWLNVPDSGGTLYLGVGATAKITQGGTLGLGPSIAAGTAASAVSALSITQTWSYNAAALDGVLWTFTDTSSHASTNAFRILGGAAGATELLKLGKGGVLTVGGAVTTPGTVTGSQFIFGSNGQLQGPTDGVFQLLDNAQTSYGALRLKSLNSFTVASDIAPTVPLYRASNAYAQATTNPNGADLVIGPGIGRRLATVVDYSLIDAGADTITITVNGTPTVGTADAATQDGTHWVIGGSNNATATNIATWMSTISGVTGAAVGASAYATFGSTVHTASIVTTMDAGEGTVTSGADGLIQIGKAVTAAAVAANFSATHYIPIKDGLGTTYYMPVDQAAW